MAPRHLKQSVRAINKRALILLVSLCLLFTSVAGGTYAWLYIDGSGSSKSSFAGTHVTLTFTGSAETHKLVPGEYQTIPAATVASGSQNCWVFARLDRGASYSSRFDTCMTYTVDSGWGSAAYKTDGQYVYFAGNSAIAAGTSFCPFVNSRITVKTTLTKETINSMSDFTFTVKYAAVQSANLTKDQAFDQISW